jgi:hypothetical protein
MMFFSDWFGLTLLVIFIVSLIYVEISIIRLRKKGIYPTKGLASMADVERLLALGYPGWAMRCYREVHRCSLRSAKEAIEKLLTNS